jgi:hypothetical protein
MKQRSPRYCYPVQNLLDLYPKDSKNGFIADVFGVARQTVIRWKYKKPCLDIYQADRLACHIGIHPANVWNDWYEKQKEETNVRKRKPLQT